jgi:hypothetical protein
VARPSTAGVALRIRKLARIAEELRGGASFSITRLTIVKSLCEDPDAAARFALHLAELTVDQMERRDCASQVDPAKWSHFKALAASALHQMRGCLEERMGEEAAVLRALLSKIKEAQNEHKHLEWGPVRIIESRELLLVENALRCVLSTDSAYWGYRVAKEYAECYDPRYGDGLIPASAPMVEEIADFWCRYHFGQPIDEWFDPTA